VLGIHLLRIKWFLAYLWAVHLSDRLPLPGYKLTMKPSETWMERLPFCCLWHRFYYLL